MGLQKLPIGESSFENMRARDYLYVDKTEYVHRMVTEGAYYFLARPRRFGKSLLVSTLRCLFQGRRELFEGLWIAEHGEWAWEEHPVIAIDFNEIANDTPEVLRSDLAEYLTKVEGAQSIPEDVSVVLMFRELIRGLHRSTGMPVAVLIDEYDKPIIEHLGKGKEELEIAIANRDILKSFFGVLKGLNVVPALRFVLLTGVSQFSKVSVFSELNNLDDISMQGYYADMLGYTQEELETYFEDYIQRLTEALGRSPDEVKAALTQWYDGYRFSERSARVYNPFSILKAFQHKSLRNYWFETGTPAFLVNLLEQERYNLPRIEDLQVSRTIFTTFEVDDLTPEAVLFQTGYLTIEDVDGRLYTLDYPNREVKSSFTESLLFSWTRDVKRETSSHVIQLSRHLRDGDLEAFFEAVTAIFASIPYDIAAQRDEAYFHTIFYLMIAASGGAAQSSVLTCRGRIDLVVTFPDKIYIIEFKCDQSAETGLRQIWERGYVEKYRQRGKKIVLMGVNFSTEKRNLEAWDVEEVDQ